MSPERWAGKQYPHWPVQSKKSEGWLWGHGGWGESFCRHCCFLAPGFLLTSCCGLQCTTPSSRGSLAAPQHPPGSHAPPAHAESKQAQENTTHMKAIDAGTSADPERGAQTPARLAGSVHPVMSDMCSVVCEPAALAARLAGAPLSGRILNQVEPPAPGTREDHPPSPPATWNMSPSRKNGRLLPPRRQRPLSFS